MRPSKSSNNWMSLLEKYASTLSFLFLFDLSNAVPGTPRVLPFRPALGFSTGPRLPVPKIQGIGRRAGIAGSPGWSRLVRSQESSGEPGGHNRTG